MKYIRMASLLFAKNLLLNLLIALQLAAAVVFGIVSFALVEDAYTGYDRSAGLEGTYLYMSDMDSVYGGGDGESLLSRYAGEGKLTVAQSLNIYVSLRDTATDRRLGKGFDTYAYDPLILDGVKESVRLGQGLSEAFRESGIVNCVVIGNKEELPIGTELPVGLYRLDVERLEDGTVKVNQVLAKAYVFRVVGWLGERADVLTFRSRSSPATFMEIDSLWEKIGESSGGLFRNLGSKKPLHGEEPTNATLICDRSALELETVDLGEMPLQSPNAIIRTENGDAEQILTGLSGEAGVVSVTRARENALAAAEVQVARYMPILGCFIAMAALGALCVGILNMHRNRQVFRSYTLCGMHFSQGTVILLLVALMLFLFAAAFAVLSWALLSMLGILPWNHMCFGVNGALFTVLFSMALFGLLCGSELYVLKNYLKSEEVI